jgi:hypothetical protein
VLWAHNDSGDDARLYAITPEGELLGSFSLGLGLAFDWEDIAIGPGPDGAGSYLYVGDIGDNYSIRDGVVTVYLVPEPAPTEAATVEQTLELATSDGLSHDFEALFVADGDIYLVAKEEPALVYRADDNGVLQLVSTLDLGAPVTGADVSWDGSVIALRGYGEIWLWQRLPGESVADTLGRQPCFVVPADERQGEALAFLADGSMVTVSEGSHPDINLIGRG